MRFRDWLLTEHGGSGGAGEFFYKLSLYPTDAFDGGEAFIDPKDVWALQGRWRIETKQGRTFHNLDKDGYIAKKFTSVQSLTMPNNRPWRHRNTGKPDLEVKYYNDMDYLGIKATDSAPPKQLVHKHVEYGLPLDSIFGDTVKTPKDLTKEFDRPLRRMRENITPYQDVGPARSINTHMGVRSKYVGPDETEDGGGEPTPIADFGFDDPGRKRGQNPYIRRSPGRKYGVPQSNDRIQGQHHPGRAKHAPPGPLPD